MVSDLSGSPEEEEEKLRHFLHTQAADVAESICRKIEKAGDPVRLWPVSTFGGHINGRPIHPLRPYNLHEPLVWLLRQSDWVLWEKTHQQAEKALDSWLWKNYTQAICLYERLEEEYGLTRGEIGQKVAERIGSLKVQRRGRTLGMLGAALVALVVIAAYVFFQVDTYRYCTLLAQLENPTEPYTTLEAYKGNYLRTLNPFASIVRRKTQIANSFKRMVHASGEGSSGTCCDPSVVCRWGRMELSSGDFLTAEAKVAKHASASTEPDV